VQAFFLKHLLFVNKISIQQGEIKLQVRKNLLCAAIADVLMNAAKGKEDIKLAVSHSRALVKPHECELIFIAKNWETVFHYVLENEWMFTNPDGCGVILLVYSIMLTHGLEEIRKEMDVQGKLTTEHGYAA
jgi:hypothetical protein